MSKIVNIVDRFDGSAEIELGFDDAAGFFVLDILVDKGDGAGIYVTAQDLQRLADMARSL